MDQVFCAPKQTQARSIGTPTPNAILDMVQEWKGMGENLFKSLADCFSDIESREQTLSSVRESLEKQLKDLEKDRRSDSFQEREREELKLREEKLDEQLKLVHEHIESLEASQTKVEGLRLRQCEKLKEIENREREIENFRGSLEKRLREVEKREKEFDTFHGEKLRELALKEDALSRKKKEFVEKVKLADEKLREKQKLGCSLIKKLELAVNMLEGMKVTMDGRFKELESRETMAYESLSAKLNEADLIRESLEKQFKEVEEIEKEINLFHEDKSRNSEPKERQIGTMRVEILKDVEMRKENLPEQQKMRRKLSQCSEQLVAKKLNKIESQELTLNVACETLDADLIRESADKQLQESIECKDQQLDCRTIEVELEGNIQDIQELKQSELTDGRFTIDPQESVLQTDGKTLEMFINSTDKGLELMDDEIFKILLLSSDPAKFVLDAVGGFYSANLGKGGKELRLRRVTILLLDQLTKMSPNIQPCVRKSATKLALEWKSTMTPTAENHLEVLGFLHLLAAYNLSSYFDKNELFSFVKSVAHHKQTAGLCRILGLAEKMPGFIQNLINEKQYLLVSTYIYECGLENIFPQSAVLNFYVTHAKLSAKAKCRRECRSSEAQDEAIASEIADLRVAIEHIIKYRLESEYSPDTLTARINQLERNQASLRHRSPSADIQKQGKSKRPWFANKRKHEEAATARYFPAWKVENQKSERYPVGFHQHRDFGNEVPTRHPSSAQKRRRKTSHLINTISGPGLL